MKVSVVIPAYNAGRTIGKAVTQSLAQARDGLEIEVVVVDDGSTDNTLDIAQSAGAKVIRQQNSGPASARNAGWRVAGGKVICFTDADCMPSEDWIVTLLGGFTDWQVGAMAGSYDIANNDSWLARWVHREIIERHNRMPRFIRAFGSYNVAMPRYVLRATGGFDTRYRRASAEDNELSYRVIKSGWHIAFKPEAKVAHYHPEKLWKYLSEQFRHGFWRAKLYKSHPDMMSGDDYTRLRDKLEPVFVVGVIMLSGLAFAGYGQCVLPLLVVLASSVSIHLSWPVHWWLRHGEPEALPYACVTFLRGFARTGGFCMGVLIFSVESIQKLLFASAGGRG